MTDSDLNSSGSFSDDEINISKNKPDDLDPSKSSNAGNDFLKNGPTKHSSGDVSQATIDKIINNENTDIPLHKQSLVDILIGIKNTFFEILDDILTQNISMDTLTKKNHMFYIGVAIVIIGIALFLYNYLTESETINVPEKIIEKHYIYSSPPENIDITQPSILNT